MMVISTKNAPVKPKRRYLPLSLSFDDGDERRRRFQQRLKIREANERALRHRSTIEDFCGAYASVTLNNRKVEIPYIDADPLNLPHAAALPSFAKSRVKPRRNHSIRPKSWIAGDGEAMLTMEHSYSAQISSFRTHLENVMSPTVAYDEFKLKLDPIKNRLQNKVSTPINSQEATRQTDAEQFCRNKMVSRGSVESNVDSAMQRLRKTVSRSKSSQPPSIARRRANDESEPSGALRGARLDDGAACARRKKFQRCNSESADAPPTPPGPSAPVTSASIIRGRSKQLQNSDSQCSNSSSGSATDKQHKNSWLTSAGKIKSAFSRVKKRQQSCDGKGDAKSNSNETTLNTKFKSHSISSEKQMMDSMPRERAALPKVSSAKEAMRMKNSESVVQEADIWTVNVGSTVKNTPSSSNENGRVQADAEPITMIDSSPVSLDQQTYENSGDGGQISAPSLEAPPSPKVPKSPVTFNLSPKSSIDRIVTEFPLRTDEVPSLASFSKPTTTTTNFTRPPNYGVDRISRHYASSPMLTITQAPKSPMWAPKSPIWAPKSPFKASKSLIRLEKAPNSAPNEQVSCSNEYEQTAKHQGRLLRRTNKSEPTHFEFHSSALRLEDKRVLARSPPAKIMSTSLTETTASAEALKRSPIGRSRKTADKTTGRVTDMSKMFSK